MSTTTTTMDHYQPAAYALRAQVAMGEWFRSNDPAAWLPYVAEAARTLPERVHNLVDRGEGRSAEYWLLQGERMAGVISAQVFQERVRALGAFELV